MVNAPVQEPLRSDLRRHDDDRYRRSHLYTALHLAGCPMLRVLQSGEPSRPATAERANEQIGGEGMSADATANSSDAANPGCFCPSSLRTYSMFSIARTAVFIAIANFQSF